MSSTHSANPIVCAAGKANLQCLFEDGLIENSKELGAVFHKELKNIKSEYNDYLYWVEGKGLVAALIFKDRAGKPLVSLCDMIAERCMQRGLLVVHTGRESIKLAPPLSISYDALLEGISVLKQSIADVIMESKYD
jgi:4-aminobutyrate aminotransferase-like enzyme